MTSVDARGKHLFLRFEGGLVIHSHLRMTGKWRVRDADWQTPRNTWLIIRTEEQLVAQINGPVLDLMTTGRARLDQRISGLGPDILAPELDEQAFLRRLRTDDPTRPIGDALLDQRIIAGIGNLWKAEGCFAAQIDPWRRTGDVSDEEALAIVRATRPRMQESAAPRDAGALQGRLRHGGQAVPALRRALEHPLTRAGRRQPDDILVPTMPTMRRIGHKGADLIEPGNTPASFDAALAHGVDMIEFDVLPEFQHEPAKGRLLLAHDYDHVAGAPTLEEGLAHLASLPFDGVDLDVDLKLPGYEARVVDALREFGLIERSLISSNWMRSLVTIRELEPAAAPRLVGPAPAQGPDADVADQAAGLRRRGLRADEAARARSRCHMAAGRCDALMAHWRLVSPRLVRAVREAGGELYVWTVDDGPRIGRLERLGVTGVITNDPRLFAS